MAALWRRAQAITPSDVTLVTVDRLFIGTGGDVSVETAGGDVVTFAGLPNAGVIDLQIRRVRATGTTASGIVGMRT